MCCPFCVIEYSIWTQFHLLKQFIFCYLLLVKCASLFTKYLSSTLLYWGVCKAAQHFIKSHQVKADQIPYFYSFLRQSLVDWNIVFPKQWIFIFTQVHKASQNSKIHVLFVTYITLFIWEEERELYQMAATASARSLELHLVLPHW